MNTPASAASTAVTAARPALAKRCKAVAGRVVPAPVAAAPESLIERWRRGGGAESTAFGGRAAAGGAAGALRVRRTSVCPKFSEGSFAEAS